jgi:hypothetical protein
VPLAAAAGLTLIGREGRCDVCTAGAGSYEFESTLRRGPDEIVGPPKGWRTHGRLHPALPREATA